MIAKVKRGKHRFFPFKLKLFCGNILSARVNFDSSCIYRLDPIAQPNINKLFGFSRGLHHAASYRFGWRAVEDKIEILAYMYRNGKRINEWDQDIHLAFIEPGQTYNFTIQIKNGECYFKILDEFNQNISIRSFQYSTKLNIGYRLNPYFGGSLPAPHDMQIYINYK